MGNIIPLLTIIASLAGADVSGASIHDSARLMSVTNVVVPPIVINFFFEPGCAECLEVSEKIIPRLKTQFDGLYRINDRDIGIMSNYLELVRYQETLGVTKNASVYMVVNDRYLFNGVSEIKAGLIEQMAAIANPLTAGVRVPTQPPATEPEKPVNGANLLTGRFTRFTLTAVLAAGFLDGIDPCAFSTLVFFMSMLSISNMRGTQLKIVGFWYCFASFVTYMLIGFGLMHTLRELSIFRIARAGIDGVIVVLLSILAFFSFRDAWRYRTTRNPDAVVLQIPRRIKIMIHNLMRAGIEKRSLALAALGLGASVTVLESVCTGQVYLPTLVLIVKSGYSPLKGMAYLLLYNVMFTVPLVTVFVVTYQGLQFRKLLDWSRNNVVFSKILLGCLFIVLAWLIVVL